MYGNATVLVLTFGDIVNGFTSFGEFINTAQNIKIRKKRKTYLINEGANICITL